MFRFNHLNRGESLRLLALLVIAIGLTAACSGDRDVGPSPASFVDLASLTSLEDSTSLLVEDIHIAASRNAEAIDVDTAIFRGDDRTLRIWKKGEGVVATAERRDWVDRERGILFLQRSDGAGFFYAEDLPQDAIDDAPDQIRFIERLGEGIALAISEHDGEGNTEFYGIRFDDQEIRVTGSFTVGGESFPRPLLGTDSDWIGVQFNIAEEVVHEYMRLSDGARASLQFDQQNLAYVFETGTYVRSDSGWTQLDFESGEVSDFDPPWPLGGTPGVPQTTLFSRTVTISLDGNVADGIWFGGEQYTELDCERGVIRFQSTIHEDFVGCDMGFGVTQTFIFDRMSGELLENLEFLPRASRVSPDLSTLVTLDSATNEVVTWNRERGVERYEAKGDQMSLDGNARLIGSEFERRRATAWIADDGSIFELPGSWCTDVGFSADRDLVAYIDRNFEVRVTDGDFNTAVARVDDCGALWVTSLFTGASYDGERIKVWKNGETIDAFDREIAFIERPAQPPFIIASSIVREEESGETIYSTLVGEVSSNTWLEATPAERFRNPYMRSENAWLVENTDDDGQTHFVLGLSDRGIRQAVRLDSTRPVANIEALGPDVLIEYDDAQWQIVSPR